MLTFLNSSSTGQKVQAVKYYKLSKTQTNHKSITQTVYKQHSLQSVFLVLDITMQYLLLLMFWSNVKTASTISDALTFDTLDKYNQALLSACAVWSFLSDSVGATSLFFQMSAFTQWVRS